MLLRILVDVDICLCMGKEVNNTIEIRYQVIAIEDMENFIWVEVTVISRVDK
jgi:hypothetical protein